MKDFEQTKAAYIEFRLKIIPVLMSVRPHDTAGIYADQDKIESWGFTAAEFAADFESFFLARAAQEYEKPDASSWEHCMAMCAEEKKWWRKAEAAVKHIDSRSIRLSQALKINGGR